MKFMIRDRVQGKTTAIVEVFLENPVSALILVPNRQQKDFMIRAITNRMTAVDYNNFDVRTLKDRVLTVQEWDNGSRGRSEYTKVLIDNLDDVLVRLLRWPYRIHTVTATGEFV